MAHESIVTLDSENFDAEVRQSDKPVLVDFWAEWCGPCKALSPLLDELAEEMGDAVKIAKVNVDGNQELAVEFGVRSIPLLLFFKDGERKDEIVGVASKDAIIAKLDALA
ncbi:MAG: thioredoxin [Verrucomicrobiales bacterium]|nr:thioredoxin [Verrucomicrobiales bacterium]MED5586532.1 thioredoxin [Verrucomicrobiota bacterium]